MHMLIKHYVDVSILLNYACMWLDEFDMLYYIIGLHI
jgi:hypothetical protein